jgi:flagellar biosynthetic protein FlhB
MAENEDGMEKSEEPTDERREEFRKKGDIPNSKELTSVGVLFTAIMVLTSIAGWVYERLHNILTSVFRMTSDFRINQENAIDFLGKIWIETIWIIVPIGLSIIVISAAFTFGQTRANFSMKKLKPNFKKFNPIENLKRIFGAQSIVELSKSFLKMLFISLVAFIILWGEFDKVPALLQLDVISSWSYWGVITKKLFLGVSGLMLIVAAIDYGYNWFQIEQKMKMTKKEVKDEYKNREIDPFVKGQLRQKGRELINGQMVENTKNATVVVANPTHFSVALLYEQGMFAPMVVAKGVDDLALKMREVAKEADVPIVENKPLARAMYKTLEVGDEIPESLFKAVSEVIRHVYKLKGIKVPTKDNPRPQPQMV